MSLGRVSCMRGVGVLTLLFLLYWTLVSALSRNHWGMGRFCRPAFARRVLIRKVFWEG